MSNEELKEILDNHKLWINGEGGCRADLRLANLSRANLRGGRPEWGKPEWGGWFNRPYRLFE